MSTDSLLPPAELKIPPEAWAEVPAWAQRIIVSQQQTIQAQQVRIEALEKRVAELEEQLRANSSNSNKPPSSDREPRAKPEKEGKTKKGGQPGHPGHHRVPFAAERVDTPVELFPESCTHCGVSLLDAEEVGEPTRHQVTEWPVIRVHVTEYRLHRCHCRDCGKATRADLPAEAPRTAFGPRFEGLVAMLVGRFRMSRREVVSLLSMMGDARISTGGVVAVCERVSAALAPVEADISAAVRAAAVAYVDETGFKEAGKKRWLWVAVTACATLFQLSPSRSRKARQELLGKDFKGLVICDRFSVYRDLSIWRRAICHAHLKRDFQAMIDRGGTSAPLGTWARAEQKRLFALYYARLEGKMIHQEVLRKVIPIKARLTKLLGKGLKARHTRTRGVFRDLETIWWGLFTFVECEGVEGTNNRAERALRPAVIWRKTCFGTASAAGNVFAQRMLSVAATCKQQTKNLFEFLVSARHAVLFGQPHPAILAPGT